MVPVLSVLFQQLAILKKEAPEFTANLTLHFVGTNYSPAHRTSKVVEPVAQKYGVVDLVQEHPERIPYHETFALYDDSDAVLLIGSNSSDYTASKLFNCVLSCKPVLALFHKESLVSQIAQRFPNVFLGLFVAEPSESQFQTVVADGLRWLREGKFDDAARLDKAVAPWLAEELTRVQCSIFDRISDKR